MTTQTLSKTHVPAYDRPEYEAFVASLPPNPDRDRLTYNLRIAETAYLSAVARKHELATRLDAIAVDLIDATGKVRERLVGERSELTGERDTLPTTMRTHAGRYADALVVWGALVYREAMREHNAAVDAISDTSSRRRDLVTKLTQLESESRYDAEAVPIREELHRLDAGRRLHSARQTEARQVCTFIEIELKRRFGDQVRQGSVHAEHVDRFVAEVAKRAS